MKTYKSLLILSILLISHSAFSAESLRFEINSKNKLTLESSSEKSINYNIADETRKAFKSPNEINNKKERINKIAIYLNELSQELYFKSSDGFTKKHVIFFLVEKEGKINRVGYTISGDDELHDFNKLLYAELRRIQGKKTI
ncbi:hypothetical protein [Shewanella waksmanii]|uniref:hypothetical protein n=1 Tax=Shewanella waksmanii TaxID=213783 RepID=UPI0004920C43|nr:hypothetical protein [Shewanella waksmanii]